MTDEQIEALVLVLKDKFAKDEISQLDFERNLDHALATYDTPEYGSDSGRGFVVEAEKRGLL